MNQASQMDNRSNDKNNLSNRDKESTNNKKQKSINMIISLDNQSEPKQSSSKKYQNVIQVQSSQSPPQSINNKKIQTNTHKNNTQKTKITKKVMLRCTLCRQQGKKNQLKNCIICKKPYHLLCLEIEDNNIPKKITCQKCKFNMGNDKVAKTKNCGFLEIDKNLKKNQKQKKRQQNLKKLNEFLNRYPYYRADVSGKIKFPVQDKLLLIYKEIFQINESVKVLPQSHPLIPNHLLGDFLQIQNFFETFSQEFQDDLSIDYQKNIIYLTMSCEGIDETFKNMQSCLLKIYLKDILQRNKTDNVKVLNENSLFVLIQNISENQELSNDFITDVAPQIIRFLSTIPSMKKAFENFQYPQELQLNSKVYILLTLLRGMSQVDEFHQLVSRRSDKIQEMTKERGDLVTQLKKDEAEALSNKQRQREIEQGANKNQALENGIKVKGRQEKNQRKVLRMASQRQKSQILIRQFKSKISNITKSLSFITTSILFLGIDRNHSQYFFYVKEPHRLYVKFHEYLFSEDNQYKIYQGKQKISQLIKSLCTKGIHQRHLSQNIVSLMKEGLIHNRTLDQQYKQCFVEKFPQNIPLHQQISLEKIVYTLLQMQKQFSTYLLVRNYQWNSPEDKETFLNLLETNKDILSLKYFIRTLQQSFLFVEEIKQSKQMFSQNSSQNLQQKLNYQHQSNNKKKIPIRIWGINSDKIRKYWIQYLQTCKDLKGVWICVFIFKNYVEKYVTRKMEHQKQIMKKNQRMQKQRERQKQKQRERQRQRQRQIQIQISRSRSKSKSRSRSRSRQKQRHRQKERQKQKSIQKSIQKQYHKNYKIESSSQGKSQQNMRYPRKSQRLNSRKLNIDSDIDQQSQSENQDICEICGEFGDMICCDTCPKVFHLDCLKIKEIPEGEWSCYKCLERMSSQRQTRSKVRRLLK